MMSTGRSWRTALLAAIVAVTLFRPPAAPATFRMSTDVELERFYESAYTWCDVDLLSAYWGQDTVEAKARIGRKIGWGDEQYIEEYLESARDLAIERGQRCAFHESEFSFEDAELLASVWGVSIGDAKVMVEDKLFYGQAGIVHDLLGEARGGGAPAPMEDPIDTFWAKGFTFCDARLVASYWQQDIIETKHELGSKIQAGNVEGVDWTLGEARREVEDGDLRGFTCNYQEEGYTYDDMVALSRFWQMTVEDTKATVEQKLLWGLNDEVKYALEQM